MNQLEINLFRDNRFHQICPALSPVERESLIQAINRFPGFSDAVITNWQGENARSLSPCQIAQVKVEALDAAKKA